MAGIGRTRHRLVRCPGGAPRKRSPGGSVSTRRRKPVPNVQRRRGNGCVSVVLRRIPSLKTRGGCLADAVPARVGTREGPRRMAVCREWRRLLTKAGVAGLAWATSPRGRARVPPEWTGRPKTTAAGAGLSAQSASGFGRRRAGVHSAPATPSFRGGMREVIHDPARRRPERGNGEVCLVAFCPSRLPPLSSSGSTGGRLSIWHGGDVRWRSFHSPPVPPLAPGPPVEPEDDSV